jgi:hypothetical protein
MKKSLIFFIFLFVQVFCGKKTKAPLLICGEGPHGIGCVAKKGKAVVFMGDKDVFIVY